MYRNAPGETSLQVMRERNWARVLALGPGFAGLLLLMAVMAIDYTRSLQRVGATTASLRRASRERNTSLDELRTGIYRSGTVARDYLVDLDPQSAEKHCEELEGFLAGAEKTMLIYERDLPAGEKEAYSNLRSQVEAYRASFTPVLRWNAADRRALGVGFVRDTLIPRRTEVVQMVKDLTALNERLLDSEEERLQAVLPQLRRRVLITFTAAILLGLALALTTMRKVRRLENEADQRYREAEEARHELSRLSDRLVTAQEEERRRLSRELHDEIGQSMSAMLVELSRVESAIADHPAQHARFASLRQIAESNVGMVRNMALLLRPPMLDDLGLIPAVKWQARETSRRTGMRVRVIADDVDDIPDAFRTCVYRLVQEALNNCARHAHASEVVVSVIQDDEGIFFSVQDDGSGFDPKQEKGLGFLGMEERVEKLGGALQVKSKAGEGTLLSVRLPLIPVTRESGQVV
jgi:signal transduction histidine kinase